MNIETAKRLYEYRKAHGFSQEELAAKIGVSRQAISKWERSESSPDTDNLIALAQLYGVSLDTLLMGESEPKKEAASPSALTEENKTRSESGGKNSGEAHKQSEAPAAGSSYSYKADTAASQPDGGTEYTGGSGYHQAAGNTTYYPPVKPAKKKKLSTSAKVIIGLVCAIAAVFIIGGSAAAALYAGRTDSAVQPNSEQDKTAQTGGETNTAGISKISVEWVAGAVYVEQYDGSTISYSENVEANSKYKMGVKTENGELEIDFYKNKGVTGGSGKELHIYIPESFELSELDISTVSADVSAGAQAGSLEISTVSGTITANGDFSDIDIETTSGDASVTSSSALIRKIDADTTSGNITVAVSKSIDGFYMEYETVSGEISNEFGAKTNGSARRGTANYGNSSTQIEAKTISGSFSLKAAQ